MPTSMDQDAPRIYGNALEPYHQIIRTLLIQHCHICKTTRGKRQIIAELRVASLIPYIVLSSRE